VISDHGTLEKGRELELSNDSLVQLYRVMVLSREIDKRCLALQRQGRITFYGTAIGQEAAFAGSVFALGPDDWLFPHYRGQTAALARGLTAMDFFSELFANSKDPAKGRQLPLFFAYPDRRIVSGSSPVGNLITQAVGAGLAAKIRGDKTVTMAHFGEGGTSTAEFHVAMNFAGVFKTPTVFVCVNNQYAISVPLRKQTAAESIAAKAVAYGFGGMRVDGNDPLAVHHSCRQAVEMARAGGGPTLIEAVSYRLEAHSTSDDPTRYRPQAEVLEWQAKDPIQRFRNFLQKIRLWNTQKEQQLLADIHSEIERAIKAAEDTPPPPLESLVQDVFADLPWHLSEQLEHVRESTRTN
jgi:TPP-dependent pyruvate/acetoin dehydrogenase alpha subunit